MLGSMGFKRVRGVMDKELAFNHRSLGYLTSRAMISEWPLNWGVHALDLGDAGLVRALELHTFTPLSIFRTVIFSWANLISLRVTSTSASLACSKSD